MSLFDRLHLGRRIAPPAFVVFTLVLIVSGLGLAVLLGTTRGVMLGFDLAALVFFAMSVPRFRRRATDIRQTAADNDANRSALLVLTAVVTLVILAAVYVELRGKNSGVDIGLSIATLVCAWLFSNLVYAFHYAHIFYMAGDAAGGLDFPDTDEPVYWDFVYFSFTLGMTFQTSDVTIRSTAMRVVTIGQCLAAFVFNLGVLAFTINTIGNAG
ncbi:putative membrane protein [Sphingomonas jinjuensis]|uniref:Putative membrane protein n=1 Tax=Sphingomonas jinjuensis TaxID=535907 RepID=A0A840FDJ0_9SPHN|nr:DUF1345 domain-containing protein [Sphingomonas jinjuensis]MBB4153637.1 putative membrane protein [Sphingomonas jinjuensis]